MRNIGLLLVLAGIVVLVYKGFSYPKTVSLIDAGPLQASFSHTEHVYLEPIVGVAGIAGGIALILFGRKSRGV
jgi:hypothetical protein